VSNDPIWCAVYAAVLAETWQRDRMTHGYIPNRDGQWHDTAKAAADRNQLYRESLKTPATPYR